MGLCWLVSPAAAAVKDMGMKRPGGAPGCCMVAGGSDTSPPRDEREVAGMLCPAPRGIGRGLTILLFPFPPSAFSSRCCFFTGGCWTSCSLLPFSSALVSLVRTPKKLLLLPPSIISTLSSLPSGMVSQVGLRWELRTRAMSSTALGGP